MNMYSTYISALFNKLLLGKGSSRTGALTIALSYKLQSTIRILIKLLTHSALSMWIKIFMIELMNHAAQNERNEALYFAAPCLMSVLWLFYYIRSRLIEARTCNLNYISK